MRILRWAACICAVLALASIPVAAQATPAQTTGVQAPAQPRAAGSYMNIGFSGLIDFGWSSERDVPSLQFGDHDPRVRGFTIPNAELSLDGAVDPYFRGFANIILKLDEEGETGIELEEMFFLTTSLPWNLQLKAGQFFAEFGRQNTQHPHSWSFVDQPLVSGRLLGPEGLRGQGARISWLTPLAFYSEATVTMLNSAGGTTFSFRGEESGEIHGGVPVERDVSGGSDMIIAPRVASSFNLGANSTILVGASAAFGPNNSGDDASTQLYGGDVYYKWTSPRANQGFPFVSLQSEVMYRRYEAALRTDAGNPPSLFAEDVLGDRGYYAQLLWGIKPRLVAGFRAEGVSGSAGEFASAIRAERTRLSPNITLYPTEFSKFRIQYNHDDRRGIGRDASLWMQFEFLLGAHAAHRF